MLEQLLDLIEKAGEGSGFERFGMGRIDRTAQKAVCIYDDAQAAGGPNVGLGTVAKGSGQTYGVRVLMRCTASKAESERLAQALYNAVFALDRVEAGNTEGYIETATKLMDVSANDSKIYEYYFEFAYNYNNKRSVRA